MLDEGAPVPVAMRGYLAAVNCATYKIIVFDAGADDAEENGYCAIMMPSSFDCRPHLDANGLEEAVIEGSNPLSLVELPLIIGLRGNQASSGTSDRLDP